MDLNAFFENISRKITPSESEKKKQELVAREVIESIQKKVKAKVLLVGSSARDTGLKGDRDLDLFVVFNKSEKIEEIVEKTRKALPKGEWVMHYAEHPYFKSKVKGFDVEVIPCFEIIKNEKLKSAVDRTPLHMKYLQERLSEKQRRDVRVLKKMLKTAGIYGAESEVSGFSGLVCEQLILNYRSLENLLENAKNWSPPVVIDIEKHYQKEEAVRKFESPFILVDAIDFNRNAGASVSETSLYKFITLSNAFLENPSLRFFFKKSEKKFKSKAKLKTITVKFKKPRVVEDILYPQLKKTEKFLKNQLEKDFQVLDSDSFYDDENAFIVFILNKLETENFRKLAGPPAGRWVEVKKFISKHKPFRKYVEGDRIVIFEERRVERAIDLIKRQLRARGVGSFLRKNILNAEVTERKGKEIEKFLSKSDFWL
jgi:tRNA nucleotidyltransferase (CCA-adding enzyme)